jgi:murein DD-endopeptidase MepM/ murein hydrolase activator NlpD
MAFESIVRGGGVKTQDFGCTWYQQEWPCAGCPRGMKWHAGIDIAAAWGTPLLAVGYGTRVSLPRDPGSCGGLGSFAVCIRSGPVDVWYGHCSKDLVGIGAPVVPGQPIALMGTLGCSTGTHVHVEVQRNGVVNGCQALNPLPYLTRWPGTPSTPPAPAPDPVPVPMPAGSSPWILAAAGAGLLLLGASQPAGSSSPAAEKSTP